MFQWKLLPLKKLRKYTGTGSGCPRATYMSGSARPHTR